MADTRQKPIERKVGVKPVFVWLIHSDSKEGPCRWGSDEELSPEAEKEMGRKYFSELEGALQENLIEDAQILTPVRMDFGEELDITSKQMEKLEPDSRETDLYLVSGTPPRQMHAVKIGERFDKPVALVTAGVTNVDAAAYLRARGLEGYAPLNYGELNDLIKLLKVRKAIGKTKILIVSDEELLTVGVVSSIWDLEDLKKRFGVESKRISFEKFYDKMGEVERDEADGINEITKDLVGRAEDVHMSGEDVRNSVTAYLATKRLMEEHECNAYTFPCFEACASKVPAERRFTPCLTHSLLKDEGYPSACEGDLSVLIAMMALMYISRKSVYMGNPSLAAAENPYMPQSSLEGEENILRVRHDVPGLKMKGFDEPDLPFEIRSFTEGGWGVTLRYDFSRDRGRKVTLARFNPEATKMLVAGGEIVGGEAFDEIGCTLAADVEVSNVKDLLHRSADYGHHLAMIYGDYTEELKNLADIMDFEIELV